MFLGDEVATLLSELGGCFLAADFPIKLRRLSWALCTLWSSRIPLRHLELFESNEKDRSARLHDYCEFELKANVAQASPVGQQLCPTRARSLERILAVLL